MYHLHAIVTIYLALGAQALTYFVSSECARKGFDETVMDEVRAMGREGSTRLQDNTNDRMAHNFQEIFKVNRDDPTVRERALTAFDTIAGLTKIEDQKQADLRIHCDNDDTSSTLNRWRALNKKEEKKSFDNRQYLDHENGMLRPKSSRGCQGTDDHGRTETLAITYKVRYTGQNFADQNQNRQTITICDEGLDFEGIEKLLSDFKSTEEDAVELPVEDFDALLSVTLFHEFCHLTQVIDVPGAKAEPFGWKSVLGTSQADAYNSADAYAFLALLALMETHNWRLARANSGDATEEERYQKKGLVYITPPPPPEGNAKRSSGSYYNPLSKV